jgi:hypothetical protein
MKRYSVFAGHMEDLMKKVTKIQNKCKKFGCDFHFAQVGEELKEVTDLEGNIITCKFIIIEAEGTAIINNWEFIASVEHTEAGNIFSKAMTDVEIPERYRTTKSICEHCNSNRTRNFTFILRNTETGEFKQVGNTCLKDFTNGLSVATATWCASIKDIFEEYESAPVSCGYHERYFSTEEVLRYTAETIRHFGFSKSENRGDSTKDRMDDFFRVDHGMTRWMDKDVIENIRQTMKQVGFNAESEEAKKMVKEALEWIQSQEATNDYMHNLKTVTALKDTTLSRFGLLVSLFPTFNRELELQAKKKQEAEQGKSSEHIGQVGDRLQIEVESVKCITSWESFFNGYTTTTTYVWKITDKQGNIFTWKTSTWLNEENPPKFIKGTVKEHKVFREIKQTELTRCSIQR